MPRRPKSKDQLKHAKRRFKQRLGIRLTPDLYKSIVTKIQNHEMEFVEAQSRRVSVYKTTIDAQPVKIIYDKNKKAIVTVLFDIC